jgi:hypothetical protein
MPAARTVDPGIVEEWNYLDINVLKPSRSAKVCVTLLTCPIHQGLIPQGEHLNKRCAQWLPRREEVMGWCAEGREAF